MGCCLEEVRVHRSRSAGELARRLGADAFTFGRHVVFGRGSWAPWTWQGQWLLAHELAHVVAGRRHGVERTTVRRRLVLRDAQRPIQANARYCEYHGKSRGAFLEDLFRLLCPSLELRVSADRSPRGLVVAGPREKQICAGADRAPVRTAAPCLNLCRVARSTAVVEIFVADDRDLERFRFPGQPEKVPALDVQKSGGGFTTPANPKIGRPPSIVLSPYSDFVAGVPGKLGSWYKQHDREVYDSYQMEDHVPYRVMPPHMTLLHELAHYLLFVAHRQGEIPRAQSENLLGHAPRPDGGYTAIGFVNRWRRGLQGAAYRSGSGLDFGTRFGEFLAPQGSWPTADAFFGAQATGQITGRQVYGSVYVLRPGDTLQRVMKRCGYRQSERYTHLFMLPEPLLAQALASGDKLEAAMPIFDTFAPKLRAGDWLALREVFWHDTIMGESLQGIADRWSRPVASVLRANPGLRFGPNRDRQMPAEMRRLLLGLPTARSLAASLGITPVHHLVERRPAVAEFRVLQAQRLLIPYR